MDRSASFWKEKLNLIAHPEGGFYREVYRSEGLISASELKKEKIDGARNYFTSIYFLLESGNFSGFHRIKQDELWNFHDGASITIHSINPQGHYTKVKLGLDVDRGEVIQHVVPANSWFASEVTGENDYALVGCMVSPGFDFLDFELADRLELVEQYPQFRDLIVRLTR